MYNIAKLSISDGLRNHPIPNGMGYLILLSAPPLANVTVRINDNTGDEIPLSELSAISVKNVNRMFISCNSLAGETITLGQASTKSDLEIITSPQIKDIEEIGKVGTFKTSARNILQFVPGSNITQHEILSNEYIEIVTDDIDGIRFHSTNDVSVEFNNMGNKFPMSRAETIFTQDINESVKFHNTSTETMTLSLMYMKSEDSNISGNTYIDEHYVEDDYVE